MPAIDLSHATWRKATKSNNNGGCVEVAFVDGHVAVRDSKNPGQAPLVFTAFEWECFSDGMGRNEFAYPTAE